MPKDKSIPTVEKFWEYFNSYCEYVKENPKYENKVNLKTGDIVTVPREVPLTWVGFENWLSAQGVIKALNRYIYNYGGGFEDFQEAVKRMKSIIYEDKYNGATAGVFQHQIIARDLGLVDKKEVNAKVKAEFSDLTEEQIKKEIERLNGFPEKL